MRSITFLAIANDRMSKSGRELDSGIVGVERCIAVRLNLKIIFVKHVIQEQRDRKMIDWNQLELYIVIDIHFVQCSGVPCSALTSFWWWRLFVWHVKRISTTTMHSNTTNHTANFINLPWLKWNNKLKKTNGDILRTLTHWRLYWYKMRRTPTSSTNLSLNKFLTCSWYVFVIFWIATSFII